MNGLYVLVDWAKGLKHAERSFNAPDSIMFIVSKSAV